MAETGWQFTQQFVKGMTAAIPARVTQPRLLEYIFQQFFRWFEKKLEAIELSQVPDMGPQRILIGKINVQGAGGQPKLRKGCRKEKMRDGVAIICRSQIFLRRDVIHRRIRLVVNLDQSRSLERQYSRCHLRFTAKLEARCRR